MSQDSFYNSRLALNYHSFGKQTGFLLCIHSRSPVTENAFRIRVMFHLWSVGKTHRRLQFIADVGTLRETADFERWEAWDDTFKPGVIHVTAPISLICGLVDPPGLEAD